MNASVDDTQAYLARLRKLIETRTQLPLITATEATILALQTIGAKTVGIIAPTPDESRRPVAKYYADAGIEVASFIGLARGLGNIRNTPAELIEEAFAQADAPEVDCTGSHRHRLAGTRSDRKAGAAPSKTGSRMQLRNDLAVSAQHRI